MTPQQALELAMEHHRAGRLPDAEVIYRQVLDAMPDHPDALQLLGTLAQQVGRPDAAVELIRRAIAILPAVPEYYNNLGNALRDAGRHEEAIAALRHALALRAEYPEAWNNLGNPLRDAGMIAESVAAHRRALQFRPEFPEAHCNLAIALGDLGRREEAIAHYREAVRLRPDYADALNNLGNALREAGQREEAVAHLRRAVALRPENAEMRHNFATALREADLPAESLEECRRVIALRPAWHSAHNNLGVTLRDLGRHGEAIEAFGRAIECKPDHAGARQNLGNVLVEQGRIEEAIPEFRRALAINPADPLMHSHLLFALHYHPGLDARQMQEEHRRWNDTHARPLRPRVAGHGNDPSPGRRLRIGYVSPDLRDHVVGRTLLPCFEAHDRAQFDIVCYSGAPPDAVTARFRAGSAKWRDTRGVSDEQLAAQVREDRIDILVDLALHTLGGRSLLFARKPAPVQVAWLGYPSTSGLEAIDYRITDRFLEPPGADVIIGPEEPLRMPDAWCCYGPPADSPAVGALPAAGGGRITFASFNNFAKLNARVLGTWAEILHRVEGSRLLLLSKAEAQPHAARVLGARGIAPDRVEFLRHYPPSAVRRGETPASAYLGRYARVDIALDPFPYNGMTTTCDALWMGAPVVALVGAMPLGRASWSLLSNVGLPELAAHSVEDYVRIAAELARDLPRLAGLRATLRERMKSSPLLDAGRLARHVEAALRTAWERWCMNPSTVVSP